MRFCYWHNHGGCTRDPCMFSHQTAPKHVKESMTKPEPRSQSQGRDPSRGRDQSKGRGKGKAKAKAKAKATPKGKAKAKAAPAKGAPALAAEAEVVADPPPEHEAGRALKKFGGLSKLWCQAALKGKCKLGVDKCPLPHISQEVKDHIQSKIQMGLDSGKAAA